MKSKEALKLSEEQFRRAIEEAPIPTIMQAEDGQVLQISRSWTELTGYSLNDIAVFDNWLTNAVYDGAQNIRNHMHELFKGKEKSINVDFTVRTHKKGIRQWSFSASSHGTLMDGRRFIIGMAVDVTEHKKAEHVIKRQAALIDISPDAIITRKLDGTITFWSDGAEKIYGYTKQEALGQKSHTLLRAKFPIPLIEINAKLNRDGKWAGELYHKAKDGREVVVQSCWLFEKAEEEEEEEEDSILESNVDITERKKAETAVKESEEQLRRAVEDAPIPMIMHAENGEVLQLSRAWTELTGYTLDEVPNFDTWLTETAYGEGANAVRNHMHALLAGNCKSIDVEFPIRAHDGSLRYWSFSASSPGTLGMVDGSSLEWQWMLLSARK